jgi:hypothetical protein
MKRSFAVIAAFVLFVSISAASASDIQFSGFSETRASISS